jgi:hypothetical protein
VVDKVLPVQKPPIGGLGDAHTDDLAAGCMIDSSVALSRMLRSLCSRDPTHLFWTKHRKRAKVPALVVRDCLRA